MSDEPVLGVEGLTFGYDDALLFDDWSAAVPPGVTAVCGGDGSGKTSLLKLIAGDLKAARGVFRVDGTLLGPGRSSRRGHIAWCDLSAETFDSLTPLVWLDRLQVEHATTFDVASLQQHIAGFALALHLAKPMYQLSTGSRRKVGIAGSLAAHAPVTLLDQPRAALDPPSCTHLMQVLAEAAGHPAHAWIVADHELPEGLRPAVVIELG